MIKIIKAGKPQPVVYSGTCKTCGCEIECHKEDTRMLATPLGERGVHCLTPYCDSTIRVTEGRIHN
jgi:hypothetical protein